SGRAWLEANLLAAGFCESRSPRTLSRRKRCLAPVPTSIARGKGLDGLVARPSFGLAEGRLPAAAKAGVNWSSTRSWTSRKPRNRDSYKAVETLAELCRARGGPIVMRPGGLLDGFDISHREGTRLGQRRSPSGAHSH